MGALPALAADGARVHQASCFSDVLDGTAGWRRIRDAGEMQSRRSFLAGATAAAMTLAGCAPDVSVDYARAQAQLRSRLAAEAGLPDLIRLATLAPSGHNTQPWRFKVSDTGIWILPDFSRRTRIVDPDDHHLFVSLGCAAENLLIAAAASGRPGSLAFSEGMSGRAGDVIRVELRRGPTMADALCPAILRNQSTRSDYDARAVPIEELKLLETTARIPGVSVLLVTESRKCGEIADYVLRGNDAQMGDAAFVEELREWIRFNPLQALRTGDGLFTRCSGQVVVPTWIGRAAFRSFYRKESEDQRYAQQLRSSAGLAIFVGDEADKDHWIRVGRSFQRFALQATALGIRHSLVNQPVEVPVVRREFARYLGLGNAQPDLLVRFGYGAAMPMSMRRPVSDVVMA